MGEVLSFMALAGMGAAVVLALRAMARNLGLSLVGLAAVVAAFLAGLR